MTIPKFAEKTLIVPAAVFVPMPAAAAASTVQFSEHFPPPQTGHSGTKLLALECPLEIYVDIM